MAKNRKMKSSKRIYPEGTAPAIQTDWAILDKDAGLCIAVYNPEGSTVRLRKVAIREARARDLSFTRVSIIPVGLMTPEKRESSKVFDAPRVEHPPKS